MKVRSFFNFYLILNFFIKILSIVTCLCISNVAYAQTVDVLMYSKHSTEEDVHSGIIEGLKQIGYTTEKGLILNIQNADSDIKKLQPMAKDFVSKKPNLIIAVTTASAQAVLRETKDIPVVLGGLTDPVMAKLLTNLEAPEANVTGTTDFVPAESQLKFIREFIPNAKRIGIIYTPTSDASTAAQLKLMKAAKTIGVEIIRGAASNLLDVQSSAKYLIENKVDAIYIPSDDLVILHADQIIKEALANKIPVFAADSESVGKGAIAGISYSYKEIGILTGKIAARILKGEKISSIPVVSPDKFQTFVNLKAAEQFGVKIPDSMLKSAAEIVK